MLAFHGDRGLKSFVLATLADPRVADRLVKDQYLKDGSGSTIGCTLEAVLPRRGLDDGFGHAAHALYEVELGIPRILAHLEDRIFERLPEEASQRWPERFISAVRPGDDLTMVWPRFALWLLGEEVPRSTAPLVQPAGLYREWVQV